MGAQQRARVPLVVDRRRPSLSFRRIPALAHRNPAVSAVALAWSAGQADVETISVVAIGGLKVETAAIPLLLSAAILFSLIRSGLEFSMQPVEVRRWKLARWDFRMALSLSRGALLLLPAAMLHRSLATGLAVVAGLVLVTAMGHVFVLVATVAFTPVMVRIRARQGRPAGAARVFEAFAWANFAGLAALAVLCFGAVFFAIRSGLVGSDDPLVVALLSLNVLVVAYSLVSQRHYLELVFAVPPGATVHLGPEGNLEVHIHATSDASLGQHQHRDDGGGPSNTKDRPWERPDGGG